MKQVLAAAVAGTVLASGSAAAHVPETEWAEFKRDYAALVARVNALEAENQQLRELGQGGVTVEDLAATRSEVEMLKKQNAASSWAENIKWKGDFRYRYEEIDQEGRDERTRHRIRARAAMIARVEENVEVGLGLASGGDDPVSTNQTLGGGGSTKDIRLDLAYARWNATDELYLQGGKFGNPWYSPQKNQLIYDGDFRPEGIAMGWNNDHMFATVSGSWIESDSNNNDDFAWGVQGGVRFGPLTAAVGYLDLPTRGREAIYDDDFFGNSAENGVYKYNYELLTAGAEFSFNVLELPLSLFAEYIENQDADDLEQGYIAGTRLGQAKKRGTWQLRYEYRELEADATLGLWTDSDFAGGGTDGKGHALSGAYAITDRWTLGFTYFDSERGVDLGEDEDYKRLMIDTAFKY
ncbi:MAG: putative porin [Halioglobus sp.]|jgi:hypothetical protein